jgi:hypothetical protein
VPTAVVTSRRVSAGITPDPGATSTLPAWWSSTDWIEGDVRSALAEHPDVCREHHVLPDTVVSVARGMAAYADEATGRDCRPTNDRLVEDVQVSLSTIKRARRVLKALGLVVELIRGRSVMTRSERITAWRRGSSHRRIAAVFALCSRPGRRPQPAPAATPPVDGDPPPSSPKESCSLKLRRTHLRRQTETSDEAALRARAPKDQSRRRAGHDPASRRLAEQVRRRLTWLSGVSARRMTPTLHRFAQAGWTPRDVERAVDDRRAARGWRVIPRDLRQPAAYLAGLLRDVDPADRPGALDAYMLEVERRQRAYERQLVHGAPCEHGRPAGNVPSPLRGYLACPSCRAPSH